MGAVEGRHALSEVYCAAGRQGLVFADVTCTDGTFMLLGCALMRGRQLGRVSGSTPGA